MASEILQLLEQVERERQRRHQQPTLAAAVQEVKGFQQHRFAASYRDLSLSPRYRDVVRFFLADLYGPLDYQQRDRDFARIVPRIEALFPSAVRSTVLSLARLHALSEELDTAMALAVPDGPLSAADYARAWRAVGRQGDRLHQLQLVLALGAALDLHTRHAWLRRALRLMRAPARAAGLSAMQGFLERGMHAFSAMQGADEFLRVVQTREASLITALFAGDDEALGVDRP
ncbi:MAG: hypothetical protein IT501_07440 [Rubrivivax sp.]|nr:hypothetical protein [Rubrivivax sp.]